MSVGLHNVPDNVPGANHVPHLVHGIKIVLLRVKSRKLRNLPPLPIISMKIIQANNGSLIGNKCIRLPTSAVETTAERTDGLTAEYVC